PGDHQPRRGERDDEPIRSDDVDGRGRRLTSAIDAGHPFPRDASFVAAGLSRERYPVLSRNHQPAILGRMLDNRWAMLAVIFIARTAMGLMFQSVAAVGPLVIDDLHLTYSQFGLLLGLFMLPGGIMALP